MRDAAKRNVAMAVSPDWKTAPTHSCVYVCAGQIHAVAGYTLHINKGSVGKLAGRLFDVAAMTGRFVWSWLERGTPQLQFAAHMPSETAGSARADDSFVFVIRARRYREPEQVPFEMVMVKRDHPCAMEIPSLFIDECAHAFDVSETRRLLHKHTERLLLTDSALTHVDDRLKTRNPSLWRRVMQTVDGDSFCSWVRYFSTMHRHMVKPVHMITSGKGYIGTCFLVAAHPRGYHEGAYVVMRSNMRGPLSMRTFLSARQVGFLLFLSHGITTNPYREWFFTDPVSA